MSRNTRELDFCGGWATETAIKKRNSYLRMGTSSTFPDYPTDSLSDLHTTRETLQQFMVMIEKALLLTTTNCAWGRGHGQFSFNCVARPRIRITVTDQSAVSHLVFARWLRYTFMCALSLRWQIDGELWVGRDDDGEFLIRWWIGGKEEREKEWMKGLSIFGAYRLVGSDSAFKRSIRGFKRLEYDEFLKKYVWIDL